MKGEGLPKQYQNRDVEYEEIAARAGRNLQRARKAKPKRASDNLLRGIVVRARGHHYDVPFLIMRGMAVRRVNSVFVRFGAGSCKSAGAIPS